MTVLDVGRRLVLDDTERKYYRFLKIIKLWVIVCGFCVLSLYAWLASDLFFRPVVPLNINILADRILPDEDIRYQATFERAYKCKTDTQRFIVKRIVGTTEEIGYRDSIIGIMTQGSDKLVQTVESMSHPALEPGYYVLRIYIVSTCSMINKIDSYPDAYFKVVLSK